MNDFINWISIPVPDDELKIWFSINNIVFEKSELFRDFCFGLVTLINETYLGNNEQFESNLQMSQEDNENHFNWCWNKIVENFKKENIFFITEGKHKEYFKLFLDDVFYNQSNLTVKKTISTFIDDLFNRSKGFSKSDLELFTEIYKLLDSNLEK
jgi:hypothetical protein